MKVALVGATGFIGQHLVTHLLAQSSHDLVLVSRHGGTAPAAPRLEHRPGDLLDAASLPGLLTDADVVVNLVAPDAQPETWCPGLAAAVLQVPGRALLHCSTATVVGRSREQVVTEQTPPQPVTPYEHRKLATERLLTTLLDGRAPLTIVRPTVVFGPGGQNLRSLGTALRREGRWATVARRLLFGDRAMHLVPVESVVRALAFLMARAPDDAYGLYQVSADNDPENGFRDVERRLATGLSRTLPQWPAVAVPTSVFSWVMALRGRSDTDPSRRYASAALERLGFSEWQPVGPAVEAFGRWLAQEDRRR